MFGRKKRQITRLLLVEDEPLIAFDTEHLLREQDYEVIATVDRVRDAVAVIDGGTDIHLVLVDMNLADGTGTDVAQAAHARSIPVMYVTGSTPDQAKAFAVACLLKPYTPRDLLGSIAAIDQMLGGKAPKRLPTGLTIFEPA